MAKKLETLYDKLFNYIYAIQHDHENQLTFLYFYLDENSIVVENEEFSVEPIENSGGVVLYKIIVNYNHFSVKDILSYIETIHDFNEKIQKDKQKISEKFSKKQQPKVDESKVKLAGTINIKEDSNDIQEVNKEDNESDAEDVRETDTEPQETVEENQVSE